MGEWIRAAKEPRHRRSGIDPRARSNNRRTMNYHAGKYRDQDTGRERWAVLQVSTRAWIFPKRYRRKAAEARARELNNHNR